MAASHDLVGQTITGVIAAPGPRNGPRTIWMLQLEDGTCVEFVTPDGRKALKRAARIAGRVAESEGQRQLALDAA